MQKIQQKKLLARILIGLLLFLFPFQAFTEDKAYGPEGKRFGVGFYLGEPAGLTLKGYLTRKFALDGVVGWSFVKEGVALMADATYDIVEIPTHSSAVSIPFYLGGGVKIAFGERGRHEDQTFAAFRVPLGLAFQLTHHPVEFFFEVAPGVQFAPHGDFDISGGAGARFYF